MNDLEILKDYIYQELTKLLNNGEAEVTSGKISAYSIVLNKITEMQKSNMRK